MIAVDTNILVYAHRSDLEWHEPASRSVESLAAAGDPWAIPWPCLHEFLGVVTNPRAFKKPSTMSLALSAIDALLGTGVVLLSETSGHWQRLRELAESGRIQGGAIHDARIAALCLDHGVQELWSADRDFGRFPKLRVRNPLID